MSRNAEGNTGAHEIASVCVILRGRRHWHARTLIAREPGDLQVGRAAPAGVLKRSATGR